MPAKQNPFRSAYQFQFSRGVNEDENTPNGSPIDDTWGYEINAFGQKVLVRTGTTNVYAKIQENLEETKIENILARAAAGDTSVFRPEGIYADLTEMPSNLLEARQAMQQLENTWEGLPNELKKKYNYDLDQFIGASGSEQWLKDMGLLPSQAEAVAEAVQETAPAKESSDE